MGRVHDWVLPCALVACVLSAAACGGDGDGPPIPADTAQSGMRLKVTWLEFDDGTRTWTHDIFDSVLGLPCTPREWADGVTRCTPPFPQVAYANFDCTEPMVIDAGGPYVLDYAADCSVLRPARVMEPTAESIHVPYVFFRDPTGQCGRSTGGPNGVGGLRAREVAVDIAELTRRYQGDGRLRIETLTSSDGFLLPVRPYDAELDIACINFDNIVFNTDGMADATSAPCILPAAEVDVFVDITCETPGIWSYEDATCAPPPFAAFDAQMAGPCRQYFAIGDTPVDFAFFPSGDSCFEVQPPMPGALIYGSTGSIEPITFERETGTAPPVGRLQPIYIGVGGTRIRERELFYDAELDTECRLMQEDVDTWSCKPVSRTSDVGTYYTDDACTQPIDLVFTNSSDDTLLPCLPRKPRRYTGYDTDFRLVGDVNPGPFYQSTPELGCFQLQITDSIAFNVGPPITATFPRATKRHD